MNIRNAVRGAAPAIALIGAGLVHADGPAALSAEPTPIRNAPLDVKLWARSVARIRTPAGVGPAILVDSEWLLASDRLVAGAGPASLEIVFESDDESAEMGVTPERWEAVRVSTVFVDGAAGMAFIQLAARGDQKPGDSRGILGGRSGRLVPGEIVHFISVDESGAKVCGRADALIEPASSCGGSSFCWLGGAGVDAVGDGAPLFDAGGCLVGVTVHAPGQAARAISIPALRASIPPDARGIGECRLPEDTENKLDLFGDRPGAGGYGGGGGAPALSYGGGSGGGGSSAPDFPNPSGIFPPPLEDFRDEPPSPPINARPDVPARPLFDNTPTSPSDEPPISDRLPDIPADSNDDTTVDDLPVIIPDPDTPKSPEPGTAALLVLALAIGAAARRR